MVASGGVPTRPIVEHLEVFGDVLLGFVSGGRVPMVHKFPFERLEEAFDAGVVPASGCAAPAGRDAMRGEYLQVRPCGILTPPIRVMPQSGLGLPGRECHTECLRG